MRLVSVIWCLLAAVFGGVRQDWMPPGTDLAPEIFSAESLAKYPHRLLTNDDELVM
jgi:hypothetical protein